MVHLCLHIAFGITESGPTSVRLGGVIAMAKIARNIGIASNK